MKIMCDEKGGLVALSSAGTLYVGLRFTPRSVLDLTDFVDSVPYSGTNEIRIKSDSFHCTVMYSENSQLTPLEFLEGLRPLVLRARVTEVEVFGDAKKVMVGKLDSQDILDFHKKLTDSAEWTSEYDYNPHVTLFNVDDSFSPADIKAWVTSANELLLNRPLVVELFSPIATTLKH